MCHPGADRGGALQPVPGMGTHRCASDRGPGNVRCGGRRRWVRRCACAHRHLRRTARVADRPQQRFRGRTRVRLPRAASEGGRFFYGLFGVFCGSRSLNPGRRLAEEVRTGECRRHKGATVLANCGIGSHRAIGRTQDIDSGHCAFQVARFAGEKPAFPASACSHELSPLRRRMAGAPGHARRSLQARPITAEHVD